MVIKKTPENSWNDVLECVRDWNAQMDGLTLGAQAVHPHYNQERLNKYMNISDDR